MSGNGSMGETMSTSNEKSRMMGDGGSFASTALGAKPGVPAKWNTDKLGLRLSLDAVSAMGSAAIICPAITIIDKAIIEKAAKGLPIRRSIASSFKTLVTRPHMFLTSTPFLLIYLLYSSTYVTANVIDTVTSTMKDKPFNAVSAGPAKFLATSTVNISLCVFKDSRFARIFGAQGNDTTSSTQQQQPSSSSSTKATSQSSSQCHPSSTPKGPPIPKTALSLFALRDSLTIFASFNLPTLLSPHIPDILASTPSSKLTLAQFSIPASVQLLSTPIHLLGLDLYNRQPAGGLPASDRYLRVKRDYLPSCFARIGRIVPAYGVGGVVNTKLRTKLMESLQRE